MDRQPGLQLAAQFECAITFVATEKFIATVAAQCDGNMLACHFAKIPRRNRRRVAERFVVLAYQLIDYVERVGLYFKPFVLGTHVIRNHLGIVRFVEIGFGKTDRKSLYGCFELLLGDRDDQRRVDPTGQKRAQGNIAPQTNSNRVGEQRAQLARGRRLIDGDFLRPIMIPIFLDSQAPVFIDSVMPGR